MACVDCGGRNSWEDGAPRKRGQRGSVALVQVARPCLEEVVGLVPARVVGLFLLEGAVVAARWCCCDWGGPWQAVDGSAGEAAHLLFLLCQGS